MKEFKVNEFLTLKLEEDETKLYVKERLFHERFYLIFDQNKDFEYTTIKNGTLIFRGLDIGKHFKRTIPVMDTQEFEFIESIDKVVNVHIDRERGMGSDERLLRKVNMNSVGKTYTIDAKELFWGHCSNLQVWAEHEYDTRLLHSRLAFPLLKILVEVGDLVAHEVFKKEIISRLTSGYPKVISYLLEERYLSHLDTVELESILGGEIFLNILNAVEVQKSKELFTVLLKLCWKRVDLLKNTFPKLLNMIERIHVDEYKVNIFKKVLHKIQGTELISYNFPTLLKVVESMKNDYKNYKAEIFEVLLEIISEVDLQKENFLVLVNSLEGIENNWAKSIIFCDLLDLIQGTELLKQNFPVLLGLVENMNDGKYKVRAFQKLLKIIDGTQIIRNKLPNILNVIENIKDGYYKAEISNAMLEIVKNTDLRTKFSFQIEALCINNLSALKEMKDDIFKLETFKFLLKTIRSAGLLKKYFPTLLKVSEDMDEEIKIDALLQEITTEEDFDLRVTSEEIFDHFDNYSIYEHLDFIGLDVFPQGQQKFNYIKYLKSLVKEVLEYAYAGIVERISYEKEVSIITIKEIVAFFSLLGSSMALTILKEEIVNLALRKATPYIKNLIPLFVARYLEQDQIDQIINELNRDYNLDDVINALLYMLTSYVKSCNDEGEIEYDKEFIGNILYRFLVNPKINILNLSSRYNDYYLVLRERFPKEFREELYRHLQYCSSVKNLVIYCEGDYKNKKYKKSLFTSRVIKEFFYERTPDLITLLISAFKRGGELGPRLNWMINFFFRNINCINYVDLFKKIIEILENGDQADLDCLIKLKLFLYLKIDDFKSIVDNPKVKFRLNFIEILQNRIDDLSYYIDFLNQYIEMMGKDNFNSIFHELDEETQICFKEGLIIKLNTSDKDFYHSSYDILNWADKNHFTLYFKLFKLISNTDTKEKYKFTNRKFGTGYKNLLISFVSYYSADPQIFDINEIAGFEELKNLKVLKFRSSGAKVKVNIKQIDHLRKLELLELIGTNIRDVSLLKNFTKLKFLDLWNNNISELMSFKNLTALEYLNLSTNKIHELPDSIGSLSYLIYLKLSDNKLITLPETIGNLQSLEVLDLRGNPLSTIPNSLIHLKSLKTLILTYTPFSHLPGSALPMPIKSLKERGVNVYITGTIPGNPIVDRVKEIKQKIIKWEEI